MTNWPPVESIEERGWRLWADPRNPHSKFHDCLMCALVRKARRMEPLVPMLARLPQRQERAS